jgi:hypothetical protein
MVQSTKRSTQEPHFIALMNELARAHHRFSLFDAEIHRLPPASPPRKPVIFCSKHGWPDSSEITARPDHQGTHRRH